MNKLDWKDAHKDTYDECRFSNIATTEEYKFEARIVVVPYVMDSWLYVLIVVLVGGRDGVTH